MPQLRRPKMPAIYNLVNDWHGNDGGVHYVAHAITIGSAAHALRGALTGDEGGLPRNHPDQQYWVAGQFLNPAISNAIAKAGGVRAIRRIEIDCSLMPCPRLSSGCLYQVPQLIRGYGLTDVPLWIFSHREENIRKGSVMKDGKLTHTESQKRVIFTTTAASVDDLGRAYNAHSDWSWVPWEGVYPAELPNQVQRR